MKYSCLITICVLFCTASVLGQEGEVFKNHIKVNALSFPLLKTSTFSYERSLSPKMSIAVGMGRRFRGKLPDFARSEEFGITFSNSGLTGYVFHGEARWYVRQCEEAQLMDGFYLGGYFKYNNLDLNTSVTFDTGEEILDNTADVSFSDFGLGLIIGYQLHLWERLVVDFLFFGPRSSSYNLEFAFEKPVSDDFLDALSSNVDGVLRRVLQRDGVEFETTEVSAKANFSSLNFRYGISVGYAF